MPPMLLIDRQPVIRSLAVGRFVFPWRGESACNTRTNRRTYPSCRFRGVHRRRISGTSHGARSRMTVKRIARTVELDIIRQLDRQIGARHRIDATQLSQWIIGIGQPQ